MGQFENIFSCKPREYSSPLEKVNHPEVDSSNDLDNEVIKRYQKMIGCLQWDVSLGRLDIKTETMPMSRFRSAPRQGHLDTMKRIYGTFKRFSRNAISVRSSVSDLGNLTY
jgi:hypothetical protein